MDNQVDILKFVAKITPVKVGFFVSIWKRNDQGITVPQDISDYWEFMIIECQDQENSGYFKFPKDILVQKNIVSGPNNRGINETKVYPSWVKTTNCSAIKTQIWQLNYFHLN